MNTGVPVRDGMLRKVQTGLLCALASFPLWPLKITTFIIIAWLISLALSFREYKPRTRQEKGLLVLFILPYLLFVFSLFTDPDKAEILFILEKKIGLIALPVFIFFSPYRPGKKEWKWVLNIYTLSVTAVVVWVNTAVFFFNGQLVEPDNNFFTYQYRKLFEAYSGVHPTYMGMFLFFALLVNLISMEGLSISRNRKALLARSLLVLVLLTAAIMLGARWPLAVFILTLTGYLFYYFGFNRYVWVSLLGMIILVTATVMLTPAIRSRLVEFSGLEWRPPVYQEHNTANIRIGIYRCSYELLKKNWITGTGPGRLQQALDLCYSLYPTDVYEGRSYNTHNEFLNHWLCLGVAGFLLFCAGLAIPLRMAWRSGQALYLVFLLLFFGCCMTENLLSRQMGVVFYALFNSLFAFAQVRQ